MTFTGTGIWAKQNVRTRMPSLIHTMYLAELCETQQRCNDDRDNAFFRVLKDCPRRRNADVN
jgi:hypothetical protein